MSTIKVGENESVESALRRFKRKCSRDGIIGDLRSARPQEKEIRIKLKRSARRSVGRAFLIAEYVGCGRFLTWRARCRDVACGGDFAAADLAGLLDWNFAKGAFLWKT